MAVIFSDIVSIAINSVMEGVIDKKEAVSMIIEASCKRCEDCRDETGKDLKLAMMTLERAIVEEAMNSNDEMTLGDAEIIHSIGGMALLCEDGRIKNIYKDSQI
ncbi:MAG: hypothetical protein HPY74_06120 [Firmicutes bacterium]|nr:hypothetical protein [Bacillota bacterium]